MAEFTFLLHPSFLLSVCVLLAAALFWQVSRSVARKQELAARNGVIATLQQSLAESETKLLAYEGEVRELLQERASLESELRAESEFGERQALFQKSKLHELEHAFEALSNRVLEKNARFFLDIAENQFSAHATQTSQSFKEREKSFHQMMGPIHESLQALDKQIRMVEKERHGHTSVLTDSIQSLLLSQQKLSKDTSALVTSLRSPTVAGVWGELHLQRVLELSGLREHCDFISQSQVRCSEGRQYRPDVIVTLPGNSKIVIDAKTPLKEYLKACNSKEEKDQRIAKGKHADTLRSHVNQLAAKRYWEQVPDSLEQVVLFLPAESLLQSALIVAPDLLEFAFQKGVLLATPTSLLAVLKAVSLGWRQENLATSSKEIVALGNTLLKRLYNFGNHFSELQNGLHRSVTAFNKAVGSYEGRVMVTARQLAETGLDVQDKELKVEKLYVEPRLPAGL